MRALPLVWCGAAEDPSGYADETRTYLVALERERVEIAMRELVPTATPARVILDGQGRLYVFAELPSVPQPWGLL